MLSSLPFTHAGRTKRENAFQHLLTRAFFPSGAPTLPLPAPGPASPPPWRSLVWERRARPHAAPPPRMPPRAPTPTLPRLGAQTQAVVLARGSCPWHEVTNKTRSRQLKVPASGNTFKMKRTPRTRFPRTPERALRSRPAAAAPTAPGPPAHAPRPPQGSAPARTPARPSGPGAAAGRRALALAAPALPREACGLEGLQGRRQTNTEKRHPQRAPAGRAGAAGPSCASLPQAGGRRPQRIPRPRKQTALRLGPRASGRLGVWAGGPAPEGSTHGRQGTRPGPRA